VDSIYCLFVRQHVGKIGIVLDFDQEVDGSAYVWEHSACSRLRHLLL